MKFLDYLVVFCFVSVSSLTITFAWIEFWYCVMLLCACIQHKMSFFLNTSQNHILLRLPSFVCFAITTNYNIVTHLSTLFLLIFFYFLWYFLVFYSHFHNSLQFFLILMLKNASFFGIIFMHSIILYIFPITILKGFTSYVKDRQTKTSGRGTSYIWKHLDIHNESEAEL